MGTTSDSESEEEVELLSTSMRSFLKPTREKGFVGAFMDAESVVSSSEESPSLHLCESVVACLREDFFLV